MGERFQLPLPMWRVHFHLLGGHRRFLAISGFYAAALAVVALVSRRIAPDVRLLDYAAYALHFLAVILLLTCIFGGCNAVHRAMLRDYETKMIESHRLTPMSAYGVVLGYLFGPTQQVLAIVAVTTVAGVLFSLVGGFPVGDWLAGAGLALTGAVMLWAGTVFLCLRPGKPVSPLPILIILATFGTGLIYLPGAALLLGVYSAFAGHGALTGRGLVDPAALAAVAVVNIALTFYWTAAAAAKYRRPELPALNAARGLVLLLIWLLLANGGLLALASGRPLLRGPGTDALEVQWTSTLIGSVLLAVVPVAGAGQCRRLMGKGAPLRHRTDRVSDWIVVVLATLLIVTVSAALGAEVWRSLLRSSLARYHAMMMRGVPPTETELFRVAVHAWTVTALTCLLGLLTARGLYALLMARFKTGGIAATAVLVTLWSVPPLVDAVRAEIVTGAYQSGGSSFLTAASPAGALVMVWSNPNASIWAGLAAQVVLAVAVNVAAVFTSRARHPMGCGHPQPGTGPGRTDGSAAN